MSAPHLERTLEASALVTAGLLTAFLASEVLGAVDARQHIVYCLTAVIGIVTALGVLYGSDALIAKMTH